MNKTFILFGLAALVIIGVGMFATMPTAGRLEARERTSQSTCRTEQVALDEGYGVSRFVERRVCDDL